MTKKQIVLKVIFYALFLLLLYFLQSAVFSRLRLFGVKPLFIPLASVCIGLFDGSLLGGFLGLACGLLCDFSMPGSSVLFTVFLPLTGFLVGLLTESILARGFPSCFVCSVITLLAAAFFQSFRLLILLSAPFGAIAKTALLQTAYSILFILPIYWSVRAISRKIRA